MKNSGTWRSGTADEVGYLGRTAVGDRGYRKPARADRARVAAHGGAHPRGLGKPQRHGYFGEPFRLADIQFTILSQDQRYQAAFGALDQSLLRKKGS